MSTNREQLREHERKYRQRAIDVRASVQTLTDTCNVLHTENKQLHEKCDALTVRVIALELECTNLRKECELIRKDCDQQCEQLRKESEQLRNTVAELRADFEFFAPIYKRIERFAEYSDSDLDAAESYLKSRKS